MRASAFGGIFNSMYDRQRQEKIKEEKKIKVERDKKKKNNQKHNRP